MTTVAIIIGLILLTIGIIGCFIPALPGPPVSYLAIIILHLTDKYSFSALSLILLGIFTLLSIIMDYILPILGAKYYGVSRKGIIGSMIGLLVGLIFFPPFGFIIGIFLGAVIGELISGKKESEALKAGIVAFIGSIMSLIFKLILSATMFFWFIMKLI